ncbi:HD domain-containing protein [Pseudonocardiaceae bacterium YIM PH 21723]|nr:HD domain-containing protein [Pseudonocardiaceae bacterium YIM PH 21723]
MFAARSSPRTSSTPGHGWPDTPAFWPDSRWSGRCSRGKIVGMDLELPGDELARDAVALVWRDTSKPIANHSVRSFLFARMIAEHQGLRAGHDYDGELVFLSCVLHDIGLTDAGNGEQRFEVDGADRAATWLTERGLDAARVDTVWEAIALHTSIGIAHRRGPVCALTQAGIGMDFGKNAELLSGTDAERVHTAYPRLELSRTLVDEITAQITARPEKAPDYSMPAMLHQERLVSGITALERRSP